MKQRKCSTLKNSDEAIWTAVTGYMAAVTSYMDSSHKLYGQQSQAIWTAVTSCMDSSQKLYGQQSQAIWTAVTGYMDSSHKLYGQRSQLNAGNVHHLTCPMTK
jgi:hypothetical protein